MNLIRSIARRFGYDAVDTTNTRRRPPVRVTYAEDDELPQNKRQSLIATGRDLYRNMSIAAWAVRRHLDYVASFTFQSRTGNKALDVRIEELMDWWSKPQNCDVARRHSLQRLVRLAEARRTVDGDVLFLKLSDGYLQPIESDRIRTPDKLPEGVSKDTVINGVQVDRYGAPRAYCICKRGNYGRYDFERMLRAGFCYQLSYFDRFDQIRGVSPLAPAINTLRDLYEGFDYALAKMKLSQLFGLTFYREASEPLDGTAEGEESGYELSLDKGPFTLDLDPGDRAEILESRSPSSEFQAWSLLMIQAALKALDIPYSAYSENFTNYNGQKASGLQYARSVKPKQADLIDFLNNITAWRLRLFVEDGHLELPAGVQLRDLYWEWIPAGIPWLDELREVNADVLAVNAGLRSRRRILKEQGLDFFDIADELAEEQEYLKAKGLNPDATPLALVESRND